MGHALSSLYYWLFPRKPVKLLILGLDHAGKTTILYQLKLGELVTTIPTIGFNVETVEHQNISFTMWDLRGLDKTRKLWAHYYCNTQSVIFVIDSTDRDRFDDALQELRNLLQEDELKGAIFLIFSNKQDDTGAMKVAEVVGKVEVDMNSVKDMRWSVVGCSATTGTGLFEGLDWLAKQLSISS